jgi:hypothetical protein
MVAGPSNQQIGPIDRKGRSVRSSIMPIDEDAIPEIIISMPLMKCPIFFKIFYFITYDRLMFPFVAGPTLLPQFIVFMLHLCYTASIFRLDPSISPL